MDSSSNERGDDSNNLVGKKRTVNDIEYSDKIYDEINVGTAISALMKYDIETNECF